MAIKQTKYFWTQAQADGTTRVGLTAEAQDELGRVKFVDLPNLDGKLAQGDTLLAVEAEKAVLDLESPLAGTIKAVHQAIVDDPELMNSTDRDKNWIADISVD
ncbi:glycine cleavage system protein H [Agrilactobacillus fermenti]|uniref:glycine cleavage system protein H n=1 Tax=Agrilactobacillus fermenti TaxID=2586909 RepID=UPI001E496666|nr:glycine cleavage system protein H [Agrilactobacillus fermenti]MCD2256448.1 glycine cleavage system protein H [Agrilactobacillus fermenti]